MKVTLQIAEPHHANKLSNLAFRSKAVWGYEEITMARFRKELTYNSDDMQDSDQICLLAECNDQIRGFVRLLKIPEGLELDALFVDPEFLGQGLGRKLFEKAVGIAKFAGFDSFLIQSDPDAEPFYLKMGAIKIGEKESGSIPGRMLPLLKHNFNSF